MKETAQRQRPGEAGRNPEGFWWGVWKNVEPFASTFVADFAKVLILLVGLALIYFVLRLFVLVGFPPQYGDVFEKMDYWATAAILGVFLMAQIWRVIVLSFRSKSK